MPLPDPQLDDRTFQDLVNEAKRLIPRYTPEWTDHNVSDPGVTLIELFAWMTDLLLYRLNRVPEKNYIRFMDLLGVQLKEAIPARTRVTFMLSAPQLGPITIARGTEVSTLRAGDRPGVSFTTDEDLVIWPPTLRHCLFSSDGQTYTDYLLRLESDGEFFDAFQRIPLPGDALYFGFAENLSSHVVTLALDCMLEGVGVDPKDPPLAWEAWCGDVRGWTRARVESDGTGGLNQPGIIRLHLPIGMETLTLARRTGHWLRLRVLQPRPRQPTYSASPRVNTLRTNALGGDAGATHSMLVISEVLGRSGGVPGESFTLRQVPVLARRPDEHIEVEDEDGHWVDWEEVASFRDSGPDDRHYTIDGVSGTVAFGPMIRQQNGTERPYGATPHKGSAIRMIRYRKGGGVEGNVGANTLTVLKTAIPYIASVTNPEAARGGLDPESLDEAKFRGPEMLRSQDRAVTVEDYEFLAKEASRRVARARCIQVRTDGSGSTVPPGTVELLIVPVLPLDHPRTLQTLQPSPELLDEVKRYLDERRLLGTQLAVDGPAFVGVSVDATVVAQLQASVEEVRQAVHARIIEYLDPLAGGPEGAGWPFGRDLYLSEMQSIVQSVPGVEFAQDVTLYQVDIQTGQSRAAGQKITIAEDVLLLSYEHTVTVAPRLR
ncbi:MAG: putative baseplate assembly protein [Chloroflexi bacterium]|nr:putative baseplate assembly protein [Chloroflexota bacterium]